MTSPSIQAAAETETETETAELLEELARTYEELHVLHGLAGILADEIDHRRIFRGIVRSLRELLPIEAAEVWVPNAARDEYTSLLRSDGDQVSASPESLAIDPALEPLLLRLGVKVLRAPSTGDSPLDGAILRLAERLGTPVVAVPLVSKEKLLGIFLARLSSGATQLDAAKVKLFAVAARQTSLAIHVSSLTEEVRANAGLRKEVEIARQIQHDLLPQSVPQSAAYDLFAGCITAAQVGGDYYDFIPAGGGELGLLIADVAGHSVASGLLAMSFRSTFRFFSELERDPGQLFTRVHRSLHGELQRAGTFLSAFYARLDEATLRLSYVNAGHNPPLVWRPSRGSFDELDEAGLIIGVLDEQEYRTAEVQLEPGDLLLLYTDGIVEAENQRGELFGLGRLKDALVKNSEKRSRELYHYLLKSMYIFQDEQFNKDDVTLAILKVKTRGAT